jgi:hypothetical protein
MTGIWELDGRRLVQLLHPLDDANPHHVRKAADELAAVARFLVHATLPHLAGETLPQPADVDRLASELRAASFAMAQTLEHLTTRLAQLRLDPNLSATQPHPGVTAVAYALSAAADLGVAAEKLRSAAHWIGQGQQYTAKLKLTPPTTEEDGRS